MFLKKFTSNTCRRGVDIGETDVEIPITVVTLMW